MRGPGWPRLCNLGRVVGHDLGVHTDQRRQRLAALYAEHANAVYAYALRRSDPVAAEDVVMEVFVVACRRLEDVPDPALPWLIGCARRVLANHRRSSGRTEALTERLRSSAESTGVSDSAAEMLAKALERLSDHDREIILLSAWEGLDLSGLALTLACSRGAAAVRLHRARRRLRAALERERSGAPDVASVEAIR